MNKTTTLVKTDLEWKIAFWTKALDEAQNKYQAEAIEARLRRLKALAGR